MSDKKAPWQVPDHEDADDNTSESPSPWENSVEEEAKPTPRFYRHTRDYEYRLEDDLPKREKPNRFKRLMVFLTVVIGLFLAFSWAYPDTNFSDSPHAIRNMIIALVFGGAMVYFSRSSLSMLARYALTWVAIIGVLSIGYISFFQDIEGFAGPAQTRMVENNGVIEVKRYIDGHFWVVTEINGSRLPMMVDTGASMVVLSLKDAERVGIKADELVFAGRSATANGVVSYATTRVDNFAIGSARFDNFYVTVNSGDMNGSLLGLDALNHFSSFEISGDVLRLKP